MKRIAIAVVLGLSALGIGQDTKAITYVTPAKPLREILKDLSQTSGSKLFVSPEFENEPLILKLQAVPLKEAMDRIASCIDAEWRQTRDGPELYRSAAFRDRLLDASIKARSEVIGKAIQEKLAEMQAGPPWSPDRASSTAANYVRLALEDPDKLGENYTSQRLTLAKSFPDQRVLWSLIGSLDAKRLASISPGERVSFSNRPTKRQLPMEEPPLQFLDRWRDDHDGLTADIQRRLAGEKINRRLSEEGAPAEPMGSRPTRVTISVRRDAFGDTMRFTLLGFDDRNEPLVAVSSELDLMKMGTMRQLVKDAQAATDSVEISSLGMQLLTVAKQVSKGAPTAVDGSLREVLLNPERTDPLAILVSDALLALPDADHPNLVASPDDVLFTTFMYAEALLKPSMVKRAIQDFGPMSRSQVNESSGWIEIKSTDPLATLAERENRAALGSFVRSIDQKGYISLADLSTVAGSQTQAVAPYLLMTIPALLKPGAYPFDQDTLALLRLYGALDEQQQQAMAKGERLKVSQLHGDALEALNQLVYQTDNRQGVPTRPGRESLSNADFYLANEPTELYPEAVPGSGTIQFATEAADVLFARLKTPWGNYAQALPLDNLASMIVQFERQEQAGGEAETVTAIAPAWQRTVQFTLNIDGEVVRAGRLQEVVLRGSEAPLEKLDSSLKTKIQERIDAYRKMIPSAPPNPKPAKPPL